MEDAMRKNKFKKLLNELNEAYTGHTPEEWLDYASPDFDETDVVDGELSGTNKSDVIVLADYAPSGPPIVSDFSFGSGTPFEGMTEVGGVTLRLSSEETEPFSTSSFRDLIGADTATVTFTFDAPITEFELSVSFVRNDEFLDEFNIGVPDALTGDLIETPDGITTSRADDAGSGTLSWTGLNVTEISFEIDTPGGSALAVDSFGITPGSGVVVDAGNGKDYVIGSLFDDKIKGGNASDSIFGNDGNDKMFGGNGKDKLDGGNGDDAASGGNSRDMIWGRSGNDTLDGGRGKDIIIGGEDDGTFSALIEQLTSNSLEHDGGRGHSNAKHKNKQKNNDKSKDKHKDDDDVGDAFVFTELSYEVGDELIGGKGKDTFIYALGDGVDAIQGFGRGDAIALLGVEKDDVVIVQDGDNSIIAFRDTEAEDMTSLLTDSAIILEGANYLDTDHLIFA